MEKNLYDEMFRVEQTHWWFVAKRKIILYLLEKSLPSAGHLQEDVHVCDLGCGCGCGCGATLVALKKIYKVTGMDSSSDAISYCKERGLNIQKGEIPSNVPYKENYYDAVLMLDVLEHVDNDAEGTISKKLSPF